ncbi:MAG TPA: GrpB family protein [Patescibacteria group bacterium]|nr:GrpB family protein [Patescibacteria group bacterium]
MPIEVVAYDPGWPARFVAIRAAIADALGDVPAIAIEHVGSTAVPGLAAKPVIDVDVIVDRSDLRRAIDALERIGYQHRGDLGIPGRHALAAPNDGARRNVYVVVDGSLALRNHRAVRDTLLSDRSLRARYGALKRRLASGTDDIDTYLAGKTRFLLDILGAAGFSDDELAAIRDANSPASVPGVRATPLRRAPRGGGRRRRR